MEGIIYNIYAVFMFVTGTLFGSFFSLATYRIPRKQDILVTRSYCPKCKHKLGFFDCFPILSYISTVGKCKYCGDKIALRYILLELINGFVFLTAFCILGISWYLLVFLVIYVILFVAIGSAVMKSKMTEEEKAQVVKKKEVKKGAINIDIIVAIIVFLFYMVGVIYTTRNYSRLMNSTIRDIDAVALCTNKINELKSMTESDFADEPRVEEISIDANTYTIVVDVYPYLKNDYEQIEGATVVQVTVSYMIDDDDYTFSLRTIRVEEQI